MKMDGWRSAHNQIHEEETRMRTPDKRRNHEVAAAVSLSTHYDDIEASGVAESPSPPLPFLFEKLFCTNIWGNIISF